LYLKNDVEEMRGEKELHDAILELHVCAMADFSLWTRAQKIAGRTTREFLRAVTGSRFTTGPGNAGVAATNVVQ